MKKKSILALSILTVMLATLVVPAYAAKKDYRANGKVTQYQGNDPNPSAIVVNGNWNLRVVDGTVDFKLSYTEMNLISEFEFDAPVGSIDLFKISAHGASQLTIDNGIMITVNTFNIDKLETRPDGSKFWRYGINICTFGTIHISPDGSFTLDMGIWHLIGTVNSMK